jgi:hypothetical protein
MFEELNCVFCRYVLYKSCSSLVYLACPKNAWSKIDGLEAILFTSSVTESVQFLNRFQRLQWLLKLMLKSGIGGHNKVVYNFIILLVLKFDCHKSDRL